MADILLERGESLERVARRAVSARNRLRATFREGLPAELPDAIETRNLDLYGDALGPTADGQLERYGSWSAVLAAACRPGRSP